MLIKKIFKTIFINADPIPIRPNLLNLFENLSRNSKKLDKPKRYVEKNTNGIIKYPDLNSFPNNRNEISFENILK
jgi:hypothetical protein